MTSVVKELPAGLPARRVRVVVADQGTARFYDVASRAGRLKPAGRLSNPAARRHERDLRTDRPGRIYSTSSRALNGAGRRGAVVRHAAGGEPQHRRLQAHRFARRIAADLAAAHRAKRFEGLVLMAGPRFLGELRAALPASLRRRVFHEVRGDFVHEPEAAVRGHIPPATLFTPVASPTRRGRP